jgi:serine protease AprX
MNLLAFHSRIRSKAVWGPKRIVWGLLLLFTCLAPGTAFAKHHHYHPHPKRPGVPGAFARHYKIDAQLKERAEHGNPNEIVRVIAELEYPGQKLPRDLARYAVGIHLDLLNGEVFDVPNNKLKELAGHVKQLHYDRPTKLHNYRTAVTVGARLAQDTLGLSGAGIGIAILDSGVSTWHDDLTNTTATLFPYGNQRVAKFVDFVNGRALPYDDNGHGTHVAGTIGGNGYDSNGEKAGIAPKASLISLKVLDQDGKGTISNIIAALGWVANNAAAYNIRVVNMSIGARIYESYWTDPLTRACRALTDKGIVVVAAAGNLGKNEAGELQWGGITAPGNAPWVLTVGASSTMGTLTRNDDTMAAYSSSGPTMVDFEAKPDLVAPGTGTVSLAVPGSTFYSTKAQYLLDGKVKLGVKPYLTLSGTSMAAPVVSGTVALMLQANPTLTPNLVKALLQYTAQQYPGYSPLRQGAGFLNTLGAVRLAQYYRTVKAGDRMPVQKVWSQQIIWGTHKMKGGIINPAANAWASTVVWGSARTMATAGDNIVWGTACGGGDCGDNIVWGTSDGDNIVWGTSVDGDNIVWGTVADGDNIVWGTDCGGADCDNVVWGTADGDNIVWGTADAGDNIVWGTFDGDNIVWGTSGDDDATWGSSGEDVTTFSDDATEAPSSIELEFGDIVPLMPATTSTVSTATVSIGG